MRPRSTDEPGGGDGAVEGAKGSSAEGAGGGGADPQACGSGRMGRMCMTHMEGMAAPHGPKTHHGHHHHYHSGKPRQQQQRPGAAEAVPHAGPAELKAKSGVLGSMGVAAAPGGGAEAATGAAIGAASARAPGPAATAVPLVAAAASASGSDPRLPAAAVAASTAQFLRPLMQPHPLLGGEAGWGTAATASPSKGQRRAASSRSPRAGLPSAAGGGGGGVDAGGGGRMGRSGSTGRVTRMASLRSSDGSGSEESDDGGGEFGFTSSERPHTLRSFQAYCAWARAVHFGLPPYGERAGAGGGRRRSVSMDRWAGSHWAGSTKSD